MSRRVAIILVASLLATSWVGALTPAVATDSRSNEGMSIIISKEVWASSETFEATIGLWGLNMGRAYTFEWEIRTGNGTLGPDVLVRNGIQNFTANSSAMQVQVETNHLNSSTTHLHRLIAHLTDNTGTLVSSQVNFSSFTNTLPVAYSDMIVFGDSLSDMGNSFNQWGTPDSPPYWNGRFSNGEVWSEQFGQFLGLTMTAGRGSANGNNRAYGGAHSGSGTYLFVIPNVGKQVDDYLQNHQINANELVVIFCGGNDFVHSDETNTQQVVDNIEGHMTDLTNAGATEFLIVELPPLDTVPRVTEERDAAGVAAMHERILDFNQKLHIMLDDTANSTSLIIHRGMAWSMFDTVYNNPSHFGLTNITHPACDHDGYTCEDDDPIASNAEEYIFFDKMHPTLTMHDLIDLYIRELMGVEDIDGDHIADIYDQCTDTLPGVETGSDGCDIPPPDADEDGVPDDEDDCDDTDSGLPVDENGCAINQIDSDGDGVSDASDQCPNTEIGRSVNIFGCSEWQLDDDEDGVVNADDDCPNTSQEKIVDENGCAANQRDSDEDGVNDEVDGCPDTDRGQPVNNIGCAPNQLDGDSDGVSDADDLCPSTLANSEDVDEDGCAPYQRDTDEDDVMDDVDQCPGTAWLDEVNEVGCSAKQRDTDGDGPKDADELCPLVPGSINGCPVLTIDIRLVGVPDDITQTANISIEVTCESGCLMDITEITDFGLLSEPIMATTNGTFFAEFTSNQTIVFEIEVRVSNANEMWKVDQLYVAFPPKQASGPDDSINSDTDNDEGQDNSQTSSPADDEGLELDPGMVALIAMLMMLNLFVFLAIRSSRSRAKKLPQQTEGARMAQFERELFGNSETSPGLPPEDSDLPSMTDLLE
ncbi:MAG: SGNH/GDSL hydrolase family protein [Candidatus Thermoplasmatota archaeon]|nr:SGNH/GDSL hydrolase family protein [Candidatus Thermoplasmatota archaeon]